MTDAMEHVTKNGIKTGKEELKLDMSVYATGFVIEGSICGSKTYGRHLT